METAQAAKRFTVRVEPDDSVFMAYCEELDLVATGSTPPEATRALLDVLWDYWLYLFNLSPEERAVPPLEEHFRLCQERLLPTMAEYGKELLDASPQYLPELLTKVFNFVL